jgi:HSP20 family molecular chaperone IbpA
MTEVFGPEPGIFGREGKFLPEADIVETEKAVEVAVELPGMKPEEVKVEIKEGKLWIVGEKQTEKEEKGRTFHRMERRSGMFRRVFELPTEVGGRQSGRSVCRRCSQDYSAEGRESRAQADRGQTLTRSS